MKMTVRHENLRSTDEVDSLIEDRILALQPHLRIDEARVMLAYHTAKSPPYTVRVHLATPGVDVVAEGRDHTMHAAIDKVITEVSGKISRRREKQRQRIRGGLQRPARLRQGRRRG